MSTAVEQIKEKLDIVEVISSYLKVEKAGINFKARCPFHNEKTASFFISQARQSFYCFGCGEKGDVFSFVEKFEGLDFKGALEVLANRAGVELKAFKKEDDGKEEDRLLEAMEEAAKMYQEQLGQNKAALEYLKKRGLKEPTISKWRLGFARDEWRSLYENLSSKGFSKETLLQAGLIKAAAGSSGPKAPEKYYDTFRNRVMFPIKDNAGRVIAFSGRAMKEDEKTPKYLNSPETKLFYKSEVLYGFDVAKNHIRKMDYSVLVEGQMDLIMSHQAGVLNTVASSGTALTELHLKKIKRLSNRVIVAYDSDSSGEKAAQKAAELALSLRMETKIASLEKGEDPASVIKEDPEKWKKALRESEHLVDFALKKALKENQGRNLTKEIIKKVLPLLSLIPSDIEKTQFVKKIALKTRVSEEAVWNDLKNISSTHAPSTGQEEALPKQAGSSLERMIVGMIFWEESHDKEAKDLKEKWKEITGEDANDILQKYEKNREALIFEAERYSTQGDIKKISEDIIRRMELQSLKKKLQETAIILDDKDISPQEEKEKKAEFEELQKKIKKLN